MGAIGAIMAYGTNAQKRIAADLVLAGDKPAILITEPEAGSAATEMTTRAVRHGDTWVINGRKTWITGGGVSRLHLIFARVIEDGRDQGIGGFLVVRNGDGPPPGITFKRIPSLGLCGMPEAETEIAGLEVPDSMVLHPPGGWARGVRRPLPWGWPPAPMNMRWSVPKLAANSAAGLANSRAWPGCWRICPLR